MFGNQSIIKLNCYVNVNQINGLIRGRHLNLFRTRSRKKICLRISEH